MVTAMGDRELRDKALAHMEEALVALDALDEHMAEAARAIRAMASTTTLAVSDRNRQEVTRRCALDLLKMCDMLRRTT